MPKGPRRSSTRQIYVGFLRFLIRARLRFAMSSRRCGTCSSPRRGAGGHPRFELPPPPIAAHWDKSLGPRRMRPLRARDCLSHKFRDLERRREEEEVEWDEGRAGQKGRGSFGMPAPRTLAASVRMRVTPRRA